MAEHLRPLLLVLLGWFLAGVVVLVEIVAAQLREERPRGAIAWTAYGLFLCVCLLACIAGPYASLVAGLMLRPEGGGRG